MTTTSIIGFDSAWTDRPKAPGAVSVIRLVEWRAVEFAPPRLASFAQALAIIKDERQRFDRCFVALDQPTIVPNLAGSRPVDKVAGALILWLGGGVRPANRSKKACLPMPQRCGSSRMLLAQSTIRWRHETQAAAFFIAEVFLRWLSRAL